MTSWVIKRKGTDEILCETFSRKLVDTLDRELYYSVPIMDHLKSLNETKPTPITEGEK